MATDIALRCHCGKLEGTALGVSAGTGQRVICYCDDCQAFARFLGRDDILDVHGGTDIFQLVASRVRITRGIERLRAMRLSPHGMTRWFSDCCRSPVGNTFASPRVPFLGLICTFMDHARDGRSRDSVLGPPIARLHARYAVQASGLPKGAHRKVPLWFILRSARFLGLAAIRDRNDPSVFFDAAGRLIVQPTVLTAAEREHLYAGRG